MDTFIEVEFDDGLVRHWEFPRASTKEEATVEVDACFGDLTEGIMVTVRHHSAPDDDSDVCRVVKDYRLSLVPPEDMPKLMVCRYCGVERLVRYEDGIVNLTKLKQLSRLYCGDEGTAGLLSDIFATSKAIEQAHQGITNEDMANLLGVPVGMLEEAQAAGFREEGEANQEHYDDGNGDGGVPDEDKISFVSFTVGDDLDALVNVGFDHGEDGAGLAAQAFADAEDYD